MEAYIHPIKHFTYRFANRRIKALSQVAAARIGYSCVTGRHYCLHSFVYRPVRLRARGILDQIDAVNTFVPS